MASHRLKSIRLSERRTRIPESATEEYLQKELGQNRRNYIPYLLLPQWEEQAVASIKRKGPNKYEIFIGRDAEGKRVINYETFSGSLAQAGHRGRGTGNRG